MPPAAAIPLQPLLLASVSLCLALTVPRSVMAGPAPQAGILADSAWQNLSAHPRLFANAHTWQSLRDRVSADPVSSSLFARIHDEADGLLKAPPVALVKEGRRLLGPVRTAEGRIFTLALTARLTGDSRYSERALAEMRHLASAPDWNPSHFLDTAEAALALGTGYDWLYDQLTPEDRTFIADAIINKALLPSLEEPNGKPLWWVKGSNNWNQVCHGGLTAGALAVAEHNPELARRIVERAIANLHYSAAAYAPDGAYPEGPMYWGYGTTFHVVLIEALRTALGASAGLDAFPGFLESADYIRQVTTPSGRFYAYSDGTEHRPVNPAFFWFARRLHRADLVSTDVAKLNTPISGEGSRFIPFALLWHDPSLKTEEISAPLSWFAHGHNPLGVHRSAWNDPRATYVAIKGGSPSVNHGHMDAGSFLIESDGVIWAVDTGAQNYYSLESKGIRLFASQPDSDRWKVFRLGPESHNILRFDGKPQISTASAKPGRFRADGDAPFTQFDLSPLYAGQVASAQRGVCLRADRRIVLQDEWTALPDQPVAVSWQWLTRADVIVTGGTVTLRQDGETLHLRVLEPAAPAARIEVEDVSAPRASYDEPNPGLKRLIVRVPTEAGSSGRITILVTPGSAGGDAPAPETRRLSAW